MQKIKKGIFQFFAIFYTFLLIKALTEMLRLSIWRF
jgi:hypothetical protein